MSKVKAFWNSLPKTVRVFFYLAVSYVLSEVVAELKGLGDDVFYIRVMAGLINLVIVFIEDAVPVVRERFSKK